MKKIGRNELCPCGSGKKFKYCHLGEEGKLPLDGMSEISYEMSTKITGLPLVYYRRSREIVEALDIKELTGTAVGIRFIDLNKYNDLNIFSRQPSGERKGGEGGVVVNVLKTIKSDPGNIYVAISPKIGDSALVHELAHVLDYLGGSKLMPGIVKPLSFDLGVPVEHLEHPQEFGYWLDYLKAKFCIQFDAEDTIISYLYKNGMLIPGKDIEKQDRFILKSKSDQIFRFLGENSAEIDELICQLQGYIGSRVGKT